MKFSNIIITYFELILTTSWYDRRSVLAMNIATLNGIDNKTN